MARFDEIEIENFRGAVGSLKLLFNQERLTVIYGENGTGKTTIVDAIDLIGNQHVGSITDRSSTNVSKHAPSYGRKPTDIKVTARWNHHRWTGSLNANKVSVDPLPTLPVRVLRRSNVQRFIDAQPSARYLEIKHLIDVDHVERSEKTLGDAANGMSTRADQFARDRATAEEILEGIWQHAGAPGSDAEAWARERISGFSETYEAREAALRTILEALNRLLHVRDDFRHAFAHVEQAETALALIEDEIDQGEGLNANQSIDLSRLLDSVQRVLTSRSVTAHLLDTCPVCQQHVHSDRLLAQVTSRLAALETYRQLDARRAAHLAQLQTEREHHVRASTRLIDAAQVILTLATGDLYGSTSLAVVSGTAITTPDDALGVAQLIETLPAWIDRERQEAAEQKGQISSLSEALETIDESTQEVATASTIAQGLRAALTIVRAKRHAFTQQILDAIADDANTLYQRLHPGEGLAMSKLTLDPKQRASLNQMAAFGGHTDVPPQAYYSEAHLDTLGFCFWLANTKRGTAKDSPIIVIDDVFSSADAQHMRRIAQLLADEAKSKSFGHIIVTTHSATFRDLLKRAGSPQLLELDHRWNLASGVRVATGKLALDELRSAMLAGAFDRQVVAGKAGILLEQVLDTLAIQYRIKMTRVVPPVYPLGDLMSATKQLIGEIQVVDAAGVERTPAGTYLKELERMDFIRNQVGAHFNPQGLEVSNHDVEDYARLAICLCETLSCAACGDIPSKWDGSGYQCRCKAAPVTMTRRLK